MSSGWKKIQDRKVGNNLSKIYRKGNVTLEIFRDSMWLDSRPANVIIRDSSKDTIESSLGETISHEHFDTEKEAMTYAKKYMRSH